jgi:hemerythrin
MKLGFAAVDEDHERLLSIAAEVEVLIASKEPAHRIRAKFHELVEYSLAHFSREETHMEAHRYPGLSVHRREHEELAEWLVHIEKKLAEDGPNASAAATDQTLAFFRAWIVRHLTTFDKTAVQFITSAADAAVEAPLRG